MRTKNRQIWMVCMLLMSGIGAYGQSYTDILENRKVTVNYPDHTVTAYLKPVESISVDSELSYTWFSGNQIRVTQGGYSGRLLNGFYQDFYLDKNLKEAGNYEKGLKQGLWKSWDAEGVLKEELNWKGGRKNGYYWKYTEKGLLLEKGKYHNDVLRGKQFLYPGLKLLTGADSVKVLHYKNGTVVQPKRFLPKISTPKFIKKLFKKKTVK